MSVVERVKQLAVPLDSVVVIGSGLLDAWGLRQSHDVDLVVTRELFDRLAQDPRFTHGERNGERFLIDAPYEVWESWGPDEAGSFASLWRDGLTIDEVRFVSPEFLIRWKRARGSEKDINDSELLETRLRDDR